jgi:alkaline phosphatase D
MQKPSFISRRTFTGRLLQAGAAVLSAPALVRSETAAPSVQNGSRPRIAQGVASGDVYFNSAIVWSRTDRQAHMVVEWSTTESFQDPRRVVGPVTDADDDFTAKVRLKELPPGQRIFYRVRFEDRAGGSSVSEPVGGRFLTPAHDERDVFFAWSGDTCGQGYGIDVSRGGMRSYTGLRDLRPDFFIHSGDTIYADIPLQQEMKLPDGTLWKNLVTPEKSKPAETLAEFRGNHRYNLLDDHVRAFNAEVALYAQWDDHEVHNNWYPGEILPDSNYTVKEVDRLARRARQAFFDYWPLRPNWQERIFRAVPRGPLCEVFLLDLRTYRGPNNRNRQKERSPETAYMGAAQLAWIKRRMLASRATWKVIASDMPIGLIVGDANNTFENCANGNGPALGRELEIADLLRFLKEHDVRNTIWLTADVHYAASNHYDPARAQFTEFQPFWEFVSGPLHAGSFAPGGLDNTFGPEMRFSSRPKGASASGPYSHEQFFSTVRIDGKSRAATVTHYDRDGKKLWSLELAAQPDAGGSHPKA